MSDYRPDEAGDYPLPSPSGREDRHSQLPDEHRVEGRDSRRYVRMYSETHNESRAYMAGRDQYIRERQDFSPLGRWIKSTATGIGNGILLFFFTWALFSHFGWGPPIRPFRDWAKDLPVIKECVQYFAK
jgi:hypothetical protein